MSGRADSETPPETAEAPAEAEQATAAAEDAGDAVGEARRARWAAIGTGGLLAVVGAAASVLRAMDAAPALVPAAYALGAAVCAGAAVLGSRGRTRRALWLLVGGVMVMAFGDQVD
ncbi:hypothetical protein AB0O67_22705 [Streptomyces sp. NPDC086077]|uniref:hypothetical protein n=1 Tax=Streptomyces sp. NPDC086077 TaxID=3154862 RepID=UPI0034122B72